MDITTALDCEARGYSHDFIMPDDEAVTICLYCGGSWTVVE